MQYYFLKISWYVESKASEIKCTFKKKKLGNYFSEDYSLSVWRNPQGYIFCMFYLNYLEDLE